MLVTLSIRDVVLIERLTLSFKPGLCVLTGETGAGKSILLDALGLALGARGDSGLVRHGADQAAVTAAFDLSGRRDHPALAILREQELEGDESLVLRRTVSSDGRSRAFVNDQPIGIALLRRLGETLVEVHGQFDTHGLLDPATHPGLLDAYAGLTALLADVAAAWRRWRTLEKTRTEAATEASRARAEEEYLRHALAELDELGADDGEETELTERRALLQNAARLVEAMDQAYGELAGDRGAERSVASALRTLARIADKAGGLLDPVISVLDEAASQLTEAARALQGLSANVETEGGSLDSVEERLFALRAAARKHAVPVSGLVLLRADMARRLSLIEDQGDLLQRLAKEAADAREHYLKLATALSAGRRKAAAKLDRAVAVELTPLKLDKARFITRIEAAPEAGWSAAGIDDVAFLVATNPGSPPGALGKIASGGELARFMLALKVVLAQIGTVPSLVFDEVDTGIGGAVADAVGERLARLGGSLQVLVVTHSPQVAARGAHHWQVRKKASAGKAVTEVATLTPLERQEEIARMLSGAAVTEAARAAAAALLSRGEGGLLI